MRSSSTWSTPILWNISPKMIWTNCRSFCHLTTLHCCRCLIVTSNSNPTTQSIQVHSILQPIGETIVKAISSWAATMQQPQSYTRCLKLHRLKITLEVWQKIFHCLNLKWMEIWWKALFQDTRKQKSSEKMIHWSPKSERTSVQNCHSYLTYIFHIITTLGDSIFQTLQKNYPRRHQYYSGPYLFSSSLLLETFFYFYLRASLWLPSYMIFKLWHPMMVMIAPINCFL